MFKKTVPLYLNVHNLYEHHYIEFEAYTSAFLLIEITEFYLGIHNSSSGAVKYNIQKYLVGAQTGYISLMSISGKVHGGSLV